MKVIYQNATRSAKLLQRRAFLGQLSAITAGMMIPGCIGNRKKSPPNIVMIISDDQGWGDYGFMGHPAIDTPNLDRLASESVVFTRGYVAAPLCCPSLASIITGLHPHQHKITSNDPPYNGVGERWPVGKWSDERRQYRQRVVEDFKNVTTIPDFLRELGYQSLQTGKWWMGNYSNGGFTQGMTHGDMNRGGRGGDEGIKIGRETMQPIYDFLDQQKNRPFFLWYAPKLPHDPFNPPKRLEEKYLKKTDSIHMARYWGNCEWFDETCGELLNYLDQKGLTDNTMILYVCDNGWIQAPDHRLNAERSKASPYEGGVRTPIMVKWPGNVKPIRNDTTLVSSIDLAPTILNVLDKKPSGQLQGVNLLDQAALKNRKAVFGANYTHDMVEYENPLNSLKQPYVIEGNWKLIWHTGRNGTEEKVELFNVIKDPKEKVELAGKYPDKVAHLKEQINAWLQF